MPDVSRYAQTHTLVQIWMLFHLFFLVFCQCQWISELWPPLLMCANTRKYEMFLFLLTWMMEKFSWQTCHSSSFHGCFLKTLLLWVASFTTEQRRKCKSRSAHLTAAANKRDTSLSDTAVLNVFALFTWDLPLMPFCSCSSQYSDFACLGLC